MFCRLETYNNIIQRSEYSIFIFKFLKSSSWSTVEQACNKSTSFITGDTVSFHIVDISESERISLAARVEEPTVVLYSRGRELVRLYGGLLEQLEYLVSRHLCRLKFWGSYIASKPNSSRLERSLSLGVFIFTCTYNFLASNSRRKSSWSHDALLEVNYSEYVRQYGRGFLLRAIQSHQPLWDRSFGAPTLDVWLYLFTH